MNTVQSPPTTGQPQYKLTDADKKRIDQITLAWKAYEGDLEKPIVQQQDEPDPNVMGNEVQPAVDSVVNFVFGDYVEIAVDTDSPKAAQDFLDQVWGRKESRVPLMQRWLMNGEASGRAFLRIVPGPDVDPPKQRVFRIVEIDPSTIFVQTAPGDCETVLLYCIQYSVDEPSQNPGKSRKVYYREEIVRIDPDGNASKGVPDDYDTWLIQHWTQVAPSGMQPKDDHWQPAGDPIPWPYSFPPIFSNQNLPKPNDFWGYPGVTKSLIGVNEAINFVNSNINVTGKIQRILYASGMGEGTVDAASGRIIYLPEGVTINSVNLQSEVSSSREFAGDLRGEAEELTGVPMIASGRTAYMPNGPQSGIAIKLLFMSLLKKMDKMRCLYGETIIEISQALLVLAGFSDDINIALGWQNPLPADILADLQAAQIKNALGVSKQTLLREFGYDPVEEAKLRAQEAAEAIANNPIVQQGQQNQQEQEQPQDNQQEQGQEGTNG